MKLVHITHKDNVESIKGLGLQACRATHKRKAVWATKPGNAYWALLHVATARRARPFGVTSACKEWDKVEKHTEARLDKIAEEYVVVSFQSRSYKGHKGHCFYGPSVAPARLSFAPASTVLALHSTAV